MVTFRQEYFSATPFDTCGHPLAAVRAQGGPHLNAGILRHAEGATPGPSWSKDPSSSSFSWLSTSSAFSLPLSFASPKGKPPRRFLGRSVFHVIGSRRGLACAIHLPYRPDWLDLRGPITRQGFNLVLQVDEELVEIGVSKPQRL